MVVDTASDITGPVTLVVNGAVYAGTAFREGTFAGLLSLRIVGGANGLRTVISPKFYQNAPARLPVTEVLTSVGEVLSATSDAATLSTTLPRWLRMGGKAGNALDALVDKLCVSWRMLPSGQLWLGPETWPVITPTADQVQITHFYPIDIRHEIAQESPIVVPGVTYAGKRVSHVTMVIGPSKTRSSVLYERT